MNWARIKASIAATILGAEFLLVGAGITSCGDEKSPIKATNTPSGQPGEIPSPPPSDIDWITVRAKKVCPYLICPASSGFEVDWRGNFEFGTGQTGALTQQELNQLLDHASRVTEQDLFASPTCIQITVLAGMSSLSLEMTLANQSNVRIYDLDTEKARLCWLGDLGRAGFLAATVDNFANQYYAAP